jgi:hypothetical protein
MRPVSVFRTVPFGRSSLRDLNEAGAMRPSHSEAVHAGARGAPDATGLR